MAEYAVMPDKTLEKLECVRIFGAKVMQVGGGQDDFSILPGVEPLDYLSVLGSSGAPMIFHAIHMFMLTVSFLLLQA